MSHGETMGDSSSKSTTHETDNASGMSSDAAIAAPLTTTSQPFLATRSDTIHPVSSISHDMTLDQSDYICNVMNQERMVLNNTNRDEMDYDVSIIANPIPIISFQHPAPTTSSAITGPSVITSEMVLTSEADTCASISSISRDVNLINTTRNVANQEPIIKTEDTTRSAPVQSPIGSQGMECDISFSLEPVPSAASAFQPSQPMTSSLAIQETGDVNAGISESAITSPAATTTQTALGSSSDSLASISSIERDLNLCARDAAGSPKTECDVSLNLDSVAVADTSYKLLKSCTITSATQKKYDASDSTMVDPSANTTQVDLTSDADTYASVSSITSDKKSNFKGEDPSHTVSSGNSEMALDMASEPFADTSSQSSKSGPNTCASEYTLNNESSHERDSSPTEWIYGDNNDSFVVLEPALYNQILLCRKRFQEYVDEQIAASIRDAANQSRIGKIQYFMSQERKKKGPFVILRYNYLYRRKERALVNSPISRYVDNSDSRENRSGNSSTDVESVHQMPQDSAISHEMNDANRRFYGAGTRASTSTGISHERNLDSQPYEHSHNRADAGSAHERPSRTRGIQNCPNIRYSPTIGIPESYFQSRYSTSADRASTRTGISHERDALTRRSYDWFVEDRLCASADRPSTSTGISHERNPYAQESEAVRNSVHAGSVPVLPTRTGHIANYPNLYYSAHPSGHIPNYPNPYYGHRVPDWFIQSRFPGSADRASNTGHIENYPNPYYGAHPYRVPDWFIQGTFPSPGYMQNYANAYEIPDWFILSRYPAVADLASISTGISPESSVSTWKPYDRVDRSSTSADCSHERNAPTRRSCDADVQASTSTGISHDRTAPTRRSCDADVRDGASTGTSRGSNVAAAATGRDTGSAGAKSDIIVIDEDDDNDDDIMIVEENSHRSIWWSDEDPRSARQNDDIVEIIDLCEEKEKKTEEEAEEGAKAEGEGENEGQEEVEVIIYEYEDNCEIWSIEPTRHADDDFEWQEIDNEIFYVGFEHMVRTHLSERLLWFDDSIDMAPALRDRLFGRRNDANTHLQEFFEKLLNYVIGRRGLSTVEWRYFFKRCFDWLKIIKICYKFPLKYNKILAYWFAKFLVQYAVHNVLCSDDNFIIGEAVISQMHSLLNHDLRSVGLTLLHMEMYRDLAIPLYRSIVNEFFMHHLSEWDVELYVIVVLCIVKWASFQRPSRVMADINRPEFLNLPSHVPPSSLRDADYGPVFSLPNLSMSRTRTLLVHQLYVPEALQTFFQIYLESVGQENPRDDSLEARRRDSDRSNEQISPDDCGAEKELERSRKRRQNLEKLPYETMPSTQSTSTHLTSECGTKRAKISTASCNNRQMKSVAYKKNSDSNLRKKSNGENSMDIIDVDSIQDDIETSQAYKPKKDSGKSPTAHKVGNLSRCSLGSGNIHDDIFSASSDISVICNNINISKNNKNKTLESLYIRNRTESNSDIYLESLYEMLDTYAPSKKERNKTPGSATGVRSSNSSNNKDQNSKSSNKTLTSLYGVKLGNNVQTSICRNSSGGRQVLSTLRRSISGVCSSDNKKNESGQVINEASEPLSEVRSNTLASHARGKLNSKRSLEVLRRGRKSNLTENSISQTNNTTLRHLYGREFLSSIRQSKTQNSQKRSYREICTVVLESSSDEESAVEKQPPSPKKLPNISAVASTMSAKSTVNSDCQKKVLSIPEQCRSIIESMATKPTRKEKHCIQGEVSSTTSHDNVGHITPTPHSEFLEVHSTDAYQNARVVGTVDVVEQPNSSFQLVNETLAPGRVLLGIDYSDDDDEDDGNDGMNDGDFLSGGYWKVIEEATSSTEITHKIQSSEVIVLSTVVKSAARPSTADSVMTCSNLMTNTNVDQSKSPTSLTKRETTSNKPVVPVVGAKIACDNCESLSDVIKCKSPSEPNCSNHGKLRTHLYNEGMGEDDSKKDIGTSTPKELSNNAIVSKQGEIANENVNPSLITKRECATVASHTEGGAQNAATNRANDDAAEGGICRSGEELGGENSAMSRSCGPVDAESDESADIEKMLADIDENLRKASEIDIKHKTEFKSVDMSIGSHSFDDGSTNEIGSFVIAESSSVGDKLNNFSSEQEDDSASCKLAENVGKLNAAVDNADDSICENELKQTTIKTPSGEKEPEPSSHRNHSEGVAENSINALECSDVSVTKTLSSPSLSAPAPEDFGVKSITLANKHFELEAASSNINDSRTCLEKSKVIILRVDDLSSECELNKLPDADISTEIIIGKNVEEESLKIVDEFVGEPAMALDNATNATNVVGILKVQEVVSMSSADAIIEPNIEFENSDNFTASNEKTQQNNYLAHHKENSVHMVERNESVENQENSSRENTEGNVCVPKCSLISDVNAKNDGTSKIASDHCEIDEQIMHVDDAILNTENTDSKQDILAPASDENPVESGDTLLLQSGSPNITQVKEIPDEHSIEHNGIGNSGLTTEETVLHEDVEDLETLTSDNNNVGNESPSNAIDNGVQKVANFESPKSVSNLNMSQTDKIEEFVKDITLNPENTDSQHNISQPDFSDISLDSRANGLSDLPTSTQEKELSDKHNSKQDIDNNSDLRESGPELKSQEIEGEGILVPDHNNCVEGNESPIDAIKNTMQTLANFELIKSISSSTFSNHSQTDKNEKFVEGITLNSNNTESDTNEILIEPSVRVMPETLPLQSHISNFTQEKELSTKPCIEEDMENNNDRQSENDLHETGVTKSQRKINPEGNGEIEMLTPVHKNNGEENESRLTAIANMVQPLANLESPAIRSSSTCSSHSQTKDNKFVEHITLNSENTDSLHSTFSNHSQTDKNEKFVEGITLNSNNTESDTNEILIEPSVRVMPETLPLQSHISNFTQEKELSTKPCIKEDMGNNNDRQSENDLHETIVTKSQCEINPEESGEIELLASVHKNNGEENESRLTAIENMVQPLANLESPAIRSSSTCSSHSQTEDNKLVDDITLNSENTDSQPHISQPYSSEMSIESKAHVLSDIPKSIEEKELPAKHCSKENMDNNSDLLLEKVIHKCTSEKSSQEIGDPEVLTSEKSSQEIGDPEVLPSGKSSQEIGDPEVLPSDYKKVGVENGSILKDIENSVQTLANLELTTGKSISTFSNHSQTENNEKYVGGISLNSDNRGPDSNEVSVDSGEIVKTDTLPLQPDIPNITQDNEVLDEQCSAVDNNSDLLSESNILENSLEKMECKEIEAEGVLISAEANEIKNAVNRLADTFSIQSQTAENVELLNDSTLNTEIADNTKLISKLNTNELQTDLRSETSLPDRHCSQKDETISSDRHEVCESGTEEDVSETGSEQLKHEGLLATEDEGLLATKDEKVGHSETDNTAKLEDDTTFNTQNSDSQNNSSQPDSDERDSGDSGVTSLLQSDIPNVTEEPKILTEYCLKDVNSKGDRLPENEKHEGDVEKELCEQSSAEIKGETLTADDNRISKDNNSTLNETRISMEQLDDLGSPVRVTNYKSCNTSPNDKCVIKPDSKQNLSQSDSTEIAAHSNDTLLSQPDISTISQDAKICSTSPEEIDHETVTAAYNKCEKADKSLLNETDNSEQQLADVSSSVNESSSVFSKPSITDKVEKRVQDTAINSGNTDSTHRISQPDSDDVSTDSKAHAIRDALSPQSVIPIVGEHKLSDDNGVVEHKLSDDNCREENATNNGEVLQESSPIKTVGSGKDEVGNESLLDKPQFTKTQPINMTCVVKRSDSTSSNNAALQINDALLERKDLVLADDSRECIVAQKDGPISNCSNSTKDKFNHIRDNECVSLKVLSVEDVEKRTPWKMRIKRRLSQCSDINKEFNIESDEEVKSDAHETTILNATADEAVHELAFDIAKLDISKRKKALGSDAIKKSDVVSTSWFKKSKPSLSVEDSDIPNIVRDDSSHSLQTENISNVDSATSRKTKCTDLCEGQNTSSDKSNKEVSEGHSLNHMPCKYNSEEIIVVTTLINMRNNYANTPQVPAKSSADTITEAKDVDGELESKTEELVPTKVVEPVVLKSILKNGNRADSIKKLVRFNEDNLLELGNNKRIEVKSASKFCKQLKTFRSAEGALLKGGNKSMKKRLCEINAKFISQLNLASGTESKERVACKVKRRSLRNKSQHIERNVETQVPTDKETPKCDENSEKHPLHSVGLTPRINKSADHRTNAQNPAQATVIDSETATNNTEVTKEMAIDVTDVECTSCDVDQTEHDPSICVRNIDIGGAKVKIKIKTREPKRGLKRERQTTAPMASCNIKQQQMKRAVVMVKRLKLVETISATSNNSNSAAIKPCEIAIKTEPADEEGQFPAPAPAPASASVPCESSDVKQEIENPAYCEPLANSCQYYYNSNNLRHSKEIILKPTDVILTEDIVNKQAKAQCYEESQRAKVRRHAFLRETESSDTCNIKSGVVKQGDAVQDHSDSTITEQPDSAKPPTTVSHGLVLKATTPTSTDEPKENIAAEEPVAKSEDIDSDADDITNAITKGVIADLKMLSPENIVVQSPPNTESIKNREVPADCGKQQKCDEERTTAQLLDSSIEMVLGNSGFAKLDASCSKPQPEGAVAVNADSKLNTSDNERVKTSPLKCRLDILTAEKINNSIEKILEHKSKFCKNIESERCAGTSLCSNLGIHSKQDGASERDAPFMCSKVDEDISKKAAKKSLKDVKVISANVPEALFADDESENSNSDEGKDVEKFFAPILCLEPINELPNKSCADKHAVTESLHENDNRNTLGTPNFTIETEVKDTTRQCDKAIDSLSSEENMNETPKDNAVPKSDAEELNANLEVTESSFSLPAIAEISAIDIPNDLSIANDYPDLLDAMLFEQVRQSMDCMISGTNSAKKWSQDSFTPSNGANHSQAEVSSRIENKSDISVGVAENCPDASETKEITLNEDALGIGQDSFLGTISPLDEVEVSTTTGFDLVGSFTMEDFLADGSGDFFSFSELDKTQSRSNSFSTDSAVGTPSPSAAVADVAGEHIMEISQSVACDHSYNKYFMTGEQPENRKLPVVKSPPISSSKIPSPKKPPAESKIFSKSKCHPTPFWKVRKNDSMGTSTPKKNDEKTFGEVQIGTLNTCSSSGEEKKDAASNDGVKGDLFYNMPVLETNSSLRDANAKVEVTANQLSAAKDTDSADAVKPAAEDSIGDRILEISNVTKTGDISMPTPHISIGDRILEISKVSETGDISMSTPHISIGDRILEISKVSETGDISMSTPHISIPVSDISKCNWTEDIKCKRQNVNPVEECVRKGPAIEITEVITIPPPIITQPIIRIQSQTNRLERIDPKPTIAQQNYLDAASESENELIDIQRACDTSETFRDTTRDSTPTLDERMKDDEEELGSEVVSIENENLSNDLPKICPKRPLTPLADAPPPKKHCSDDEVKALSTNDMFDMLKQEESLEKKVITTETDVAPNCNETVTSTQPQCRTPVAETANLGNKIDTNFSAQALPQILPTIEKVKCVETLGNTKVKGSSINTPSTSSTDAATFTPLSTSTDQSTQIIQCKSNVVVLQSSPAQSYKTKNTTEVAAETKLNDNVKSRNSCEVSSQKNQDEASHNIGSTKRDNPKKNSPSIRLSTETVIGNAPVRCDNLGENSKPCHQPIRQRLPSSAESMRDVDISATSSRAEPLAQHSSRTLLKPPLGKDLKTLAHTLGKSSPQAKPVLGVIEKPLIKIESFTPSPHYSPISPSVRHNVARMSPASTLSGKNRVHPYQKFTSTPTNYKNKYIYQRDTLQSSADSSHTHISTQRTDTAKALKSAPPVTANPAVGLNISSIKLSASDNAMISSKLESYRATLPEAKTYKEHRENQRLIKLQEEKLKLEFLEREKRRQAQTLLAEAQRLKRKSHAESHEGHYKKFSGSSVSTPASSRYANQHFQQNQRYRQRQKYVNKFSEIEKQVVTVGSEKFVAAKGAHRDYVGSVVSAPLTTSTAWEPKSASVDEIIAHLTKSRKS